jgi:hypothetical protein
MKFCSKCKIEKSLEEFHKNKSKKDGLANVCKKCIKEINKKRKEEKKEYDKNNYKKNKKIKLDYQRQYYEKNKKDKLDYQRQYYKKNKKEILEYKKNNREKINKNLINFRKKSKNYLSLKISTAIRKSIKNKNKYHWENLVGYSLQELIEHLEKVSDFTIQDYLEKDLHIDHIIPVNLYKFENYEDIEFKKCWNKRNLRIITAEENLTKRDKLDVDLIEQYQIKDLLP